MGWWKADPVPEQPQPATIATKSPPAQPAASLPSPSSDASACPVDPKTRQIWLQQAQQKGQSIPRNHPPVAIPSSPVTSSPTTANQAFAAAPSEQCSSDRIDQSLPTRNTANNTTSTSVPPYKNLRPLSNDREISSIPRAYAFETPGPSSSSTNPNKTIPSNAESETGHDKASGNWIYPSESQFFNAVMRKNQSTSSPAELASSVSSIIPIHNAVNERAWTMIRRWEANQPANKTCNGPKLLRFEGKGAGAKSPRAVMKSWSGYSEPFDRHDWTIQRCDGTEVEYVIDFYQGRSPAGQVSGASQGAPASGMGGLNFYLDVRPKLNSFEGCRLRFTQFLGMS